MFQLNKFLVILVVVFIVSNLPSSAAKPLDIYDEILGDDKLFLRMAELIESIGSDDDDDGSRRADIQNVNPAIADRCTQPVRKGVCRALIPRWSYDPITKKCEEFKFGGCDGNGNNFSTQKQCLDMCQGS